MGTTETITFEPGQSIATAQVMISNDNVYEGVQEFSARLTTTDSGVNFFEPEATIQITDDDGNLNSHVCINLTKMFILDYLIIIVTAV